MNFKENKIRIVLNKSFKDDPIIIIRGSVIDEDEKGILVTGRIFMKIAEEGRMLEKPIDDETKLLFVPFNSMRFSEFIVADSKYAIIHKNVLKEPPLSSSQINREGAF